MFCSKCGKQIDDNATFCKFCGTPQNGAQPAAPQQMQQQQAPMQNSMPQYGAPQYGAPQPMGGGMGLNLAPSVVNLTNLIHKGMVAISCLLVVIGCIGIMATIGKLFSLSSWVSGANANAEKALTAFSVLIRVGAIMLFVVGVSGAVFAGMTKQKQTGNFAIAGLSTVVFVFHFIMFGLAGGGIIPGVIVFGIIMLIVSFTLISMSIYVTIKKGYLNAVLKK